MRCPFAVWRGPIANMKPGGMVHPVRGLVLHVEEGTETGTDSWFRNPAAQASAHFGVARDGVLHQWVDTDDRAWAESAGNAYWWSVETEGTHTEPLTDSQVATLARLYGWLASLSDRIPTVLAESVNDRGFGWHGMGGAFWGGHYSCPGDLRRAQRADVLARIVRPAPSPVPPIPSPVAIIWNGAPAMKNTFPVPIDTNGNGKAPIDVAADKLDSMTPWAEGQYKNFEASPLNVDGKVEIQVTGHTPSAAPPADPWWAYVTVVWSD